MAPPLIDLRLLEHLLKVYNAADMRDKSILAPTVVTICGIGAIGAGWLQAEGSYLQGLLLQIGSSFVLLVPLFLLGRMLEKRAELTEKQTKELSNEILRMGEHLEETNARLEAIGRQSFERVQDYWQHAEEAVSKAEQKPSFENVRNLMKVALETGAFSDHGVRVRIGDTSRRILYRLKQSAIKITVLDHLDNSELSLDWEQSMPFSEVSKLVSVQLSEASTFMNLHPEDLADNLGGLLSAARVAIENCKKEWLRQWGPMVELITHNWVLSEKALYRTDRTFAIPSDRLLNTHEDWKSRMREEPWVDYPEYLLAHRVASNYFRTHPPRYGTSLFTST